MPTSFHFEHNVCFTPEVGAEELRRIPALPGVLALFGPHAEAQPYLTRTADLRRRATRLLGEPHAGSKRLNLRDRVARIGYTVTGSEFESSLVLYHAAAALLGLPEARRRLKLHTPFFLRYTADQAHPRVYSTNRLSKRGLAQTYGPFPSRAAAERYADAVLDLFKLRRCYEDLAPHPDHPGCAYGEMKKCLSPCNLACTPDAYAAEAAAVQAFFDTRGESMLERLAEERDQASAAMDFEAAAALHGQHQKVKAAAALADELVRPVPRLRAIIVQPSPPGREETQSAAVFLLAGGCLAGPEPLSTLGVRAVKEQTSVGSSLFAQPLMLQAVPLGTAPPPLEQNNPEERAARVVAGLETKLSGDLDTATLSDHLSLLRRWVYRPEKQRTGEIFYPNADGAWPLRRILRGAARMALGEPAAMAETQRDQAPIAAEAIRTRILHQGRPDVERTVPVIAKPELPQTFTSRRKRPARGGVDTLIPSGSPPPEGHIP